LLGLVLFSRRKCFRNVGAAAGGIRIEFDGLLK
jgi:hypothetical protein